MDDGYTYNTSSQDEDILIEMFLTTLACEIHPTQNQTLTRTTVIQTKQPELLMKEDSLLSYYQTLIKHTLQLKENKKTLLQLPTPFSLFPIKILTKIDTQLPPTINYTKKQ